MRQKRALRAWSTTTQSLNSRLQAAPFQTRIATQEGGKPVCRPSCRSISTTTTGSHRSQPAIAPRPATQISDPAADDQEEDGDEAIDRSSAAFTPPMRSATAPPNGLTKEPANRNAAEPSGRPLVSAAHSADSASADGSVSTRSAKWPAQLSRACDAHGALVAPRQMRGNARPAPVLSNRLSLTIAAIPQARRATLTSRPLAHLNEIPARRR